MSDKSVQGFQIKKKRSKMIQLKVRMHSDMEWLCEGVKVWKEGTLTSHTLCWVVYTASPHSSALHAAQLFTFLPSKVTASMTRPSISDGLFFTQLNSIWWRNCFDVMWLAKKKNYWTELLCLVKMHLQSEASRPQYTGREGGGVTWDDVWSLKKQTAIL